MLFTVLAPTWVGALTMVAALCRAAAGGDGVELLDGYAPPP